MPDAFYNYATVTVSAPGLDFQRYGIRLVHVALAHGDKSFEGMLKSPSDSFTFRFYTDGGGASYRWRADVYRGGQTTKTDWVTRDNPQLALTAADLRLA